MNYSLIELDKIKELLIDRRERAYQRGDNIYNSTSEYRDDPEWMKCNDEYNLCDKAIDKLNDLLDKAVDDFIKTELLEPKEE